MFIDKVWIRFRVIIIEFILCIDL